jgi:ADP-ribose pyrophosphatase YjhB (NUDIX family)
MINENKDDVPTMDINQNQTSEVASYPFSMGERPKNIDKDDVPTRDVTQRVGGDEKFGQRAFAQPSLQQLNQKSASRSEPAKRVPSCCADSDDFGVKYEKKKYFDVCNNCGKQGHTFKQCKNPITSFGVIVFRINPLQQREYLMIRRKDTLGYIDFMRGKYSASNQKYIFNMIEQMTIQEKYKLKKYTFDELWHDLWIEEHSLLSTEDILQPPDQTRSSSRKTSLPRFCEAADELVLNRDDVGVLVHDAGETCLSGDALTEDLDDMDMVSVAERSDDLRSSHSGLSPPNTTNVSGDFVTGDVLRVSTHILKDDVGVLQNMMKPLSEDTIIDTSTIYQTYKQEEMNSRDKFIYLTTKYIKDIPHQSNLLPYLQKMSCKHDQDHETPVTDWSERLRPSHSGLRPPNTTNFKDNFVTGEIWESREDKGAISILHYLIELSIQNSTNEEQDPIQDLNEELPLHGIRDERSNIWTEPEWGFPKGRRNFQEKDYDCALREMTEETGYPLHLMKNMKNILPFDEIFLGSNYKSYKHRYYLMYMNYEDSLITDRYDRSEVSMMRWKTYEECLLSIRPYNLEKKRLIKNIEITLSNYFHTATGLPKTYSHR